MTIKIVMTMLVCFFIGVIVGFIIMAWSLRPMYENSRWMFSEAWKTRTRIGVRIDDDYR